MSRKKRISFGYKDADLLYEIIHHCSDHQTWMREVFDNGESMGKIEIRLLDFINMMYDEIHSKK